MAEIVAVGLGLAKNVFQFMELTALVFGSGQTWGS